MKKRTAEEILDWHLHQMGKHIVGLHESDLYKCAIKAINEALTIPVVVGQSEQYCDDNEVTHNRYRLTDGFAYCPDCGQEL